MKEPLLFRESQLASIDYKNYVIDAVPRRLAKPPKWQVDIIVRKFEGGRMRSFSAKNSYYTKEETIPHCFHFGMQIIDGIVPGKSVADL